MRSVLPEHGGHWPEPSRPHGPQQGAPEHMLKPILCTRAWLWPHVGVERPSPAFHPGSPPPWAARAPGQAHPTHLSRGQGPHSPHSCHPHGAVLVEGQHTGHWVNKRDLWRGPRPFHVWPAPGLAPPTDGRSIGSGGHSRGGSVPPASWPAAPAPPGHVLHGGRARPRGPQHLPIRAPRERRRRGGSEYVMQPEQWGTLRAQV